MERWTACSGKRQVTEGILAALSKSPDSLNLLFNLHRIFVDQRLNGSHVLMVGPGETSGPAGRHKFSLSWTVGVVWWLVRWALRRSWSDRMLAYGKMGGLYPSTETAKWDPCHSHFHDVPHVFLFCCLAAPLLLQWKWCIEYILISNNLS